MTRVALTKEQANQAVVDHVFPALKSLKYAAVLYHNADRHGGEWKDCEVQLCVESYGNFNALADAAEAAGVR